MGITKGTIVRSVMLGIILINWILKNTGHPIIEVEEGTVASFIELLLEIGTIAVAWWKNNSFSESAIKADQYLKTLREQKEIGE